MTMTLKEYQDILYDILCEVDNVCKKNNIKYTLYGGTMLGAVRHQGFIPWDDDIDIAVQWKDYDRLCRKLREELPNYLRVIEPIDFAPHFYDYTTRVVDMRYLINEPDEESKFYDNKQNYACLDIFTFAYSANGALGVACLAFCHKVLYGLGMGHRFMIKSEDYSLIQKIQVWILSRLGSLISMEKIIRWRTALINIQVRKKRKYHMCVNALLRWIGVLHESQWYEATVPLHFRDRELPVPSGYDKELTLLYGDYMVPVKEGYVKHIKREKS